MKLYGFFNKQWIQIPVETDRNENVEYIQMDGSSIGFFCGYSWLVEYDQGKFYYMRVTGHLNLKQLLLQKKLMKNDYKRFKELINQIP